MDARESNWASWNSLLLLTRHQVLALEMRRMLAFPEIRIYIPAPISFVRQFRSVTKGGTPIENINEIAITLYNYWTIIP